MPQVVVVPEAPCRELAGETADHDAVSWVFAGMVLIPHLSRS